MRLFTRSRSRASLTIVADRATWFQLSSMTTTQSARTKRWDLPCSSSTSSMCGPTRLRSTSCRSHSVGPCRTWARLLRDRRSPTASSESVAKSPSGSSPTSRGRLMPISTRLTQPRSTVRAYHTPCPLTAFDARRACPPRQARAAVQHDDL